MPITADSATLVQRVGEIVELTVGQRIAGNRLCTKHFAHTAIIGIVVEIAHDHNQRIGIDGLHTIDRRPQLRCHKQSVRFALQFTTQTRREMIDKQMQCIAVGQRSARIQNVARGFARRQHETYGTRVNRPKAMRLIEQCHIDATRIVRLVMHNFIIQLAQLRIAC